MTLDELKALPIGSELAYWEVGRNNKEMLWIKIDYNHLLCASSLRESEYIDLGRQVGIYTLQDFQIKNLGLIQWPDDTERGTPAKCSCETHQLMWGGCACGGI